MRGGLYYLALGSVTDPDVAAREIAHAVGLRQTDGRSLAEAVADHLRRCVRKPSLLVLDNFEQLLAAAPLLVRMLDACAHLTILVTSRAVLRVSGEMVFPVPPLPVPQADRGVDRAVLLRNPAVALFVERAVATAPTFAFTDDNAAAIAEVCRRLDGLPLAIELAAARIKVLTPREICDRLTSRLELLTGGAADLPPRQQTLRNTLEWSHTLLNPAEQRFFRRLSVFPGGCTLEAAEAVCDTARDLGVGVLDGMSSLLDKHLVHQVGETASERRFSMLETVREFASGQLETYLESAKARQAHAAYCLVVAEEVVLCRTPSEFASWLAKCDAERENHRAALEYLVGSANAEWALRLGVALYRYREHREYLTEGRAWFEAILTLPGAAATTAVRARALAYAATFAQHQGDHAVAAAGHRESLECWRTLGDRKGTIAQLNSLAACERFRGNYDAARAWGKETLDACRTLGDTTAIAAALSNLVRSCSCCRGTTTPDGCSRKRRRHSPRSRMAPEWRGAAITSETSPGNWATARPRAACTRRPPSGSARRAIPGGWRARPAIEVSWRVTGATTPPRGSSFMKRSSCSKSWDTGGAPRRLWTAWHRWRSRKEIGLAP